MPMNEEWKDIIGYEGCYQVSNLGRVKSLDRVVITPRHPNGNKLKGRMIKFGKTPRGRLYVVLCKDGVPHNHLVNRLVGIHFLPLPSDYEQLEVMHIDNNDKNNYADNLKWGTRQINCIDAWRDGLMEGVRHSVSKITEAEALEIRHKYIPYKYSMGRLSKEYGINAATIHDIIHRKSWKHI